MDKFPLYGESATLGELTAEQEGLYTWFEVRCRLPEPGLWYAWVVGDGGELRLGILEPSGDRAGIRRRISKRMTAPLGNVLRGEIRLSAVGEEAWQLLGEPQRLFHTPYLCQQLQKVEGALVKTAGKNRLVALPYDPQKPFGLTRMFCFARVTAIRGKPFAVFLFDEDEIPRFP